MRTLRKIINQYMYQITCFLVMVIVIIILSFQIKNEQKRIYDNAKRIFAQMEQVLLENEKELENVTKEYEERCLHNAEVIARILVADPELLYRPGELRELAVQMEVDEIHVIDINGCIFSGTHPDYYGYTLDSGDQIRFFKPMLADKNMKLVQEIRENTAESRLMQYSAVWSENKAFIVQVGMNQVNVKKATEKNELSYLFSLFRVNPEANYYAIQETTGIILASTNMESVGKHYEPFGFPSEKMKTDEDGFHACINGVDSFCVFQKMDDTYIGRVVSVKDVYERVPRTVLELIICLVIIAFVLAKEVTRHMDKYVVNEIRSINTRLQVIAQGNLEETVEVNSSTEFSELSDYINRMVKSLLENNTKMSYVLKKTKLNIGVYEYNRQMKNVRLTGDVERLLAEPGAKNGTIPLRVDRFREYLDTIRRHPLEQEAGVYRIGEGEEKYIHLEENVGEEETFGVIIDVTEEVMRRRKIEEERDIDSLTGLYNRRGLDERLAGLFEKRDALKQAAVIMLDADGLKGINDSAGHEMGDAYLKKIGEIISHTGNQKKVAARQGGDEFVLFLYDYGSREELDGAIRSLEEKQSGSYVSLNDSTTVPLRFSIGYSYVEGEDSYSALIKTADEKMYRNKMKRKKEINGEQ